MPLDPRLNAFRADIAAADLRGKVDAAQFVEGTEYEIADGQAPLRRAPRHDAPLDTEALHGERITIYEIDDEGWAWGQLRRDGYVGFVPAAALARPRAVATHRVTALRTYGFPGADIKLPPHIALPFSAQVAVTREAGALMQAEGGIYLPAAHLAPLATKQDDFVAVAERFVGTPYLWGGKTSLGLDCSGLVQISLQAAGTACPRDSDMQAALGAGVPLSELRRGDLLFWKGHVAIARDALTLLHANAHHMAVAIEPAADALKRIRNAGGGDAVARRL